jgi:hypothetical protein
MSKDITAFGNTEKMSDFAKSVASEASRYTELEPESVDLGDDDNESVTSTQPIYDQAERLNMKHYGDRRSYQTLAYQLKDGTWKQKTYTRYYTVRTPRPKYTAIWARKTKTKLRHQILQISDPKILEEVEDFIDSNKNGFIPDIKPDLPQINP